MQEGLFRIAARVSSSLGMMALAACATPTQVLQPIEVQSVRLTAAGHYLDLRYRVLDPAAAQAALGPKVRPQLIDEVSGSAMAVPMTAKLGALRQTQATQQPGRTYFVMFVNSSGVQPGSKVTAELGALRFPHLTVE
jgi:hypothetical protein